MSAHEAQALVRAGGHWQADGLPMNAKVAQLALPTNVGDFDAVGCKEAGDFLIAGVSAHGWMGEREGEHGKAVPHRRGAPKKPFSQLRALGQRGCGAAWEVLFGSSRVPSRNTPTSNHQRTPFLFI
jgi:hypothetical protein